jgi:hypothetical protein
MELLVQAFRAAISGDPARAEVLLAELGPFANPELEAWRQGTRVRTVVRGSVEREEQLLAELEAWAAAGPPLFRAKRAVWLGNLRYRQYRFREAAALFAEAAATYQSHVARLGSLINEAGAWLDALELAQASNAARQGQREAAALRLTEHEARATLIERAAAYRAGTAESVRVDLVDAGATLTPYSQGLFMLTEAAVGWRVGDRATAAWLAGRARDAFRSAGLRSHGLLAAALIAACMGTAEGDAVRLAEEGEACGAPEIAVQILGLLARANPRRRDEWVARARAVELTRSPLARAIPLDVLSINECVEVEP